MAGMMGLPPVPPPMGAPTLTSSMAGEAPRNAAGIPSLFYQAEQQLKQIAFILPSCSGEINDIIDQLRSMMANSLSGGGPSPDRGQPGLGGITSPTEDMKSGY